MRPKSPSLPSLTRGTPSRTRRENITRSKFQLSPLPRAGEGAPKGRVRNCLGDDRPPSHRTLSPRLRRDSLPQAGERNNSAADAPHTRQPLTVPSPRAGEGGAHHPATSCCTPPPGEGRRGKTARLPHRTLSPRLRRDSLPQAGERNNSAADGSLHTREPAFDVPLSRLRERVPRDSEGREGRPEQRASQPPSPTPTA